MLQVTECKALQLSLGLRSTHYPMKTAEWGLAGIALVRLRVSFSRLVAWLPVGDWKDSSVTRRQVGRT